MIVAAVPRRRRRGCWSAMRPEVSRMTPEPSPPVPSDACTRTDTTLGLTAAAVATQFTVLPPPVTSGALCWVVDEVEAFAGLPNALTVPAVVRPARTAAPTPTAITPRQPGRDGSCRFRGASRSSAGCPVPPKAAGTLVEPSASTARFGSVSGRGGWWGSCRSSSRSVEPSERGPLPEHCLGDRWRPGVGLLDPGRSHPGRGVLPGHGAGAANSPDPARQGVRQQRDERLELDVGRRRRPPRPSRRAPGRRAPPCCRSARRSGRRWSARR